MNPIHLLRMRRWVQHPPSWRRVKLAAAVVLAALAVWGLDRSGLWPDWARADRVERHGVNVRP